MSLSAGQIREGSFQWIAYDPQSSREAGDSDRQDVLDAHSIRRRCPFDASNDSRLPHEGPLRVKDREEGRSPFLLAIPFVIHTELEMRRVQPW